MITFKGWKFIFPIGVIEWLANDTRSLCSPTLTLDWHWPDTTDSYVLSTLFRSTPRRGIYIHCWNAGESWLLCIYLRFFSLSFSRSCRTRRRLIVANGPSSWRHERGNGIKPRRAARDLLIVTTSCRGAARRRASGRDSDSSQDSYIMCVHRLESLLFCPFSRFPSVPIFLSAIVNLFVACVCSHGSAIGSSARETTMRAPLISSCGFYRARVSRVHKILAISLLVRDTSLTILIIGCFV